MKQQTVSLILTSLVVLASAKAVAQVGKMDIGTHDIVIQKLEGAVNGLDKKIGQKAPIILRLADLYADRARLKFIAETEKNCDSCLGSKQDRQAAIKHYLSIIKHVEGDTQAQALIQTAHLYKMNGEVKKALELYKSVAESKKNYAPIMKGSALAGVGETLFQMAEFKKAMPYLERALRIEDTPQRGYVQYRLAWCQLNQGQTQKAIKTMENLLSTPELLQLQSSAPGATRNSFHEDVSRDFATFLSKTSVGQKEIDLLMENSPDPVKRSNLYFLGTETDRLGQKQGSLLVWNNYVSQNQLSPKEELEILIRVAQLQYDIGNYAKASSDFDRAISLWKKKGCSGNDCEELRVRLRNFVTVWNKAIKKNPTLPLLRAYQSYVSLFSTDIEMMYWAGDVARIIKRPSDAMNLYYQTSVTAYEMIKQKSDRKDLQKIFEGSLIAQIEMAEATKNAANRKKAYDHYLALNPNGANALQVKYQLAQLMYDAGQYEQAAVAYKNVAYEKDEKQRALRIKAADLSLDALALAKKDEAIESWSPEFAKLLPERKAEYLRLARKASLNLVAQALKNPKSSQGDYERANTRLNGINMSDASKDESIAYFKNKMLLGEFLKDLNQVESASNSLLKIKGLSDSDERLALQYQLWVAEMRLEFNKVFELSKKVEVKASSKDQKYLKQAIFAELAGRKDAEGFYREFIKATPSRQEANVIRATLIRKDNNMWPEIIADLGKLSSSPEILSALALEAYSKNKDRKSAEKVLKYKTIQNHAEGRALARTIFLEDFAQFERKISQHNIVSSSDKLLARTLKERISLLNESEVWAAQAVKSTDWTLQLLTLDRVAHENARLYKTLMALPVPRALNGAQRAEYQKMLSAQAAPFNDKARKIEDKLDELWSNSDAIARIKKDIKVADGRVAKLFEQELRRIAAIASPSMRKDLLAGVDKKTSKPSRNEIMTARGKIRQDPFNRRLLEELRQLENEAGGQTMVTYLDARIDALKNPAQGVTR